MIKVILSWLLIIISPLLAMWLGVDKIFEIAGRFILGCDKWIDYGGWHFACVIIGWVIVLYAIGITYLCWRKKK